MLAMIFDFYCYWRSGPRLASGTDANLGRFELRGYFGPPRLGVPVSAPRAVSILGLKVGSVVCTQYLYFIGAVYGGTSKVD